MRSLSESVCVFVGFGGEGRFGCLLNKMNRREARRGGRKLYSNSYNEYNPLGEASPPGVKIVFFYHDKSFISTHVLHVATRHMCGKQKVLRVCSTCSKEYDTVSSSYYVC